MLLVVLLLPAISMTDDLMAASSPAEAEHILQQDVLLSDVPGGTSLDPGGDAGSAECKCAAC